MLAALHARIFVFRAKHGCTACKAQFIADLASFFAQFASFSKENGVNAEVKDYFKQTGKLMPQQPQQLPKCEQCGRRALRPLLAYTACDLTKDELREALELILSTDYGMNSQALARVLLAASDVAQRLGQAERPVLCENGVQACGEAAVADCALRQMVGQQLGLKSATDATILMNLKQLQSSQVNSAAEGRQNDIILQMQERIDQLQGKVQVLECQREALQIKLRKANQYKDDAQRCAVLAAQLQSAENAMRAVESAASSEERMAEIRRYRGIDTSCLGASGRQAGGISVKQPLRNLPRKHGRECAGGCVEAENRDIICAEGANQSNPGNGAETDAGKTDIGCNDTYNATSQSQSAGNAAAAQNCQSTQPRPRTQQPAARQAQIERLRAELESTRAELAGAVQRAERSGRTCQRLQDEAAKFEKLKLQLPALQSEVATKSKIIVQQKTEAAALSQCIQKLNREIDDWRCGVQDLTLEICKLQRALLTRHTEAFQVDLQRYQNIFDELAPLARQNELMAAIQNLSAQFVGAEFADAFLEGHGVVAQAGELDGTNQALSAGAKDEHQLSEAEQVKKVIQVSFNSSTEIYLYYMLNSFPHAEIADKAPRFKLQWDFGQPSAVRLTLSCAVLLAFGAEFYQNEEGVVRCCVPGR